MYNLFERFLFFMVLGLIGAATGYFTYSLALYDTGVGVVTCVLIVLSSGLMLNNKDLLGRVIGYPIMAGTAIGFVVAIIGKGY